MSMFHNVLFSGGTFFPRQPFTDEKENSHSHVSFHRHETVAALNLQCNLHMKAAVFLFNLLSAVKTIMYRCIILWL